MTAQTGDVYTALVTPFQKDGSVDWESFENLLERQIRAGVTGVVPCGTTGESPTLTHSEKLEMFKRTVKIAKGRCKVMAGTGSNNTAESVDLSKEACALGVDSLLVVVPYYNKPSQAGLEAHYSKIADAASKPVVLYNVPGRTITSLSASTVARLAEHPNIAGIKEATGNMAVLTEMRREVRARTSKPFFFLSGDDPTLLPFLTAGGNGVISVASNILPKTMVTLCRELPLETFETLFHFFNALFVEANPVPCKTLLSWQGLCGPTLRLPLVGMSEESAAKLKKAWNQLPQALREDLKA